jgi:hypothetical protein
MRKVCLLINIDKPQSVIFNNIKLTADCNICVTHISMCFMKYSFLHVKQIVKYMSFLYKTVWEVCKLFFLF